MRTRIITALIMLAVVLSAIYLLPVFAFKICLAVLMLALSWEWAGLSAVSSSPAKLFYLIVMAGFLAAVQWLGIGYLLLIIACFIWVLALFAVIVYARGNNWLFSSSWLQWPAGWVLLAASYYGLIILRTSTLGVNWLVIALATVWIMDSAAYFAGRAFGRHSLAKRVSPKKTLEGLFGGFICLLLYVALLYFFYPSLKYAPLLCFALILSGLWSVLGDLFESACKRVLGVKDSGTILPGHGGLWDRLDGMLAALPWLALFTLWH